MWSLPPPHTGHNQGVDHDDISDGSGGSRDESSDDSSDDGCVSQQGGRSEQPGEYNRIDLSRTQYAGPSVNSEGGERPMEGLWGDAPPLSFLPLQQGGRSQLVRSNFVPHIHMSADNSARDQALGQTGRAFHAAPQYPTSAGYGIWGDNVPTMGQWTGSNPAVLWNAQRETAPQGQRAPFYGIRNFPIENVNQSKRLAEVANSDQFSQNSEIGGDTKRMKKGAGGATGRKMARGVVMQTLKQLCPGMSLLSKNKSFFINSGDLSYKSMVGALSGGLPKEKKQWVNSISHLDLENHAVWSSEGEGMQALLESAAICEPSVMEEAAKGPYSNGIFVGARDPYGVAYDFSLVLKSDEDSHQRSIAVCKGHRLTWVRICTCKRGNALVCRKGGEAYRDIVEHYGGAGIDSTVAATLSAIIYFFPAGKMVPEAAFRTESKSPRNFVTPALALSQLNISGTPPTRQSPLPRPHSSPSQSSTPEPSHTPLPPIEQLPSPADRHVSSSAPTQVKTEEMVTSDVKEKHSSTQLASMSQLHISDSSSALPSATKMPASMSSPLAPHHCSSLPSHTHKQMPVKTAMEIAVGVKQELYEERRSVLTKSPQPSEVMRCDSFENADMRREGSGLTMTIEARVDCLSPQSSPLANTHGSSSSEAVGVRDEDLVPHRTQARSLNTSSGVLSHSGSSGAQLEAEALSVASNCCLM